MHRYGHRDCSRGLFHHGNTTAKISPFPVLHHLCLTCQSALAALRGLLLPLGLWLRVMHQPRPPVPRMPSTLSGSFGVFGFKEFDMSKVITQQIHANPKQQFFRVACSWQWYPSYSYGTPYLDPLALCWGEMTQKNSKSQTGVNLNLTVGWWETFLPVREDCFSELFVALDHKRKIRENLPKCSWHFLSDQLKPHKKFFDTSTPWPPKHSKNDASAVIW